MGLVINTNRSSLMIQRNLTKSTSEIDVAMTRLSTGLRINSASDDAAGLALSEKLKAQINSSDVVKTNIQSGINMMQIAEADLGVIQDNLQRMRELAVQSANEVYSSAERAALNSEYQERIKEINRVGASSEFSGISLLDGSATVDLQIGTNNNAATDRLTVTSLFTDILTDTDMAAALGGDLASIGNSQSAIGQMDAALKTVSGRRAGIGASVNMLSLTLERTDVRKENLAASLSVIRDTDVAIEAANLTRAQILQQSATSLLQQANQAPVLALNLL